MIREILRSLLLKIQKIKLVTHNRNLLEKEVLTLTKEQLVLQKLRLKVQLKQKIRVCFFVMYDASFAGRTIYEAMLEDELFEPFIVVIPDTLRGEKHQNFNLKKTYEALREKYTKVYLGFDYKSNKYTDYSTKTDLVCFPNVYEELTNRIFTQSYYLDKETLTFYINYSFGISKFSNEMIKRQTYNEFWKIFVPTQEHLNEFKKHQMLKGSNVVVTGYPKIDDLSKQIIREKDRKKLIIAPHHTVTGWKYLHISNFLKYADFFLKLPIMYPQIDFVFRPHPLLLTQLKRNDIWGENKTNFYFNQIEAIPNMIYDQSGEYFDLFANSDGIVHDCGSFLAEYLYTDKPACYMLKNKRAIKKWFSPIGQKCLQHCYKAFSKKDILDFIDNTIIKNIDPLKKNRIDFVNRKLKINYPFSSEYILNYIKNELLRSNI